MGRSRVRYGNDPGLRGVRGLEEEVEGGFDVLISRVVGVESSMLYLGSGDR